MKRILLPLAALAMISACKKADPAPVATDTAMASEAAATTPAAMPTVGANARTTLQFAGDYRQTAADGKATSLALAADDSYVWTDATGKVTKGKSWPARTHRGPVSSPTRCGPARPRCNRRTAIWDFGRGGAQASPRFSWQA